MKKARSGSHAGFTLIELLVVIAIIAVLIALLVPAVQKVRESAARVQCTNNLKQLALGCHNYHDANKELPPNYLDAYGTANHGWSWIAFILPYIDQQPLYDLAKLTPRGLNGIPTSPLNVAGGSVIATPITMLRCPSDTQYGQTIWTDRADVAPTPVAVTNYKGVAGANWEWGIGLWNPGYNPNKAASDQEGLDNGNGIFFRSSGDGGSLFAGTYGVQRITFQSITDGSSNTFMIGESLPSMSQWTGCWAYSNNACGTCAIYPNAPQTTANNFAIGDWPNNYSFHSNHPGGLQFAFADGTVRFVADNIDITIYRGLATRDGGEAVTLP